MHFEQKHSLEKNAWWKYFQQLRTLHAYQILYTVLCVW